MRNVRQALRLVQQGGQRGSAAGKLISTTTTTAQRQLASTAARVIGSQYAGSSSAAAATSSTTAASTLQQQQQQQSLLGRRTFAESKTLGTPAEAAAQSKATSTATTAGGVDAEYIRTAIQKMLQENEKANHKKKKNKKSAALSNGTEASSTATKAEKDAGAAEDSGATSESTATATVVVSDEDLEKHADKFQYRLDEAKSCVLDCAELVAVGTDREEWDQGYEEAEVAIGSCVASLIEFLELLNATTDEAQLRRYDALRQSSTVSLKELRQQLKDFENQYKHNNSPNSQSAK